MWDPNAFIFDLADGNHRIFHEDYPNVIKSWDFHSDPDTPRNYTPRELVPFLPLKFPYNLVRLHIPRSCGSISNDRCRFQQIVYLSSPILVPTALGIVYVRILMQGRESRRRVEEIEKADSYSSKLIHAVAELEREMEDKVAEFIDTQTGPTLQPEEKPSKEKEEDKWWVSCSKRRDGEHACFCSCKRKKKEHLAPEDVASGSVSSASSSKGSDEKGSKGGFRSLFKHSSRAPSPDPSSETSSIAETDSKAEGKCKWRSHKKSHPKVDAPILLDVQREMIERLNKLSGLKKERAFYDDTRNSHASIVCREDRGFDPDVVDSTLRHWVDGFVF